MVWFIICLLPSLGRELSFSSRTVELGQKNTLPSLMGEGTKLLTLDDEDTEKTRGAEKKVVSKALTKN